MPNPRCEFVKADGSQCAAYATDGATLCINHNPELAGLKRAAVEKGGSAVKRAALPPLKLTSYHDIQPAVETIIHEVREARMSSSEANTLLRLLRWEAELLLGIPPKCLL